MYMLAQCIVMCMLCKFQQVCTCICHDSRSRLTAKGSLTCQSVRNPLAAQLSIWVRMSMMCNNVLLITTLAVYQRSLNVVHGLQIWQVLPLVPPETMAWSPYSGLDALCGNVLLISLDTLVEDGLLSKSDLPSSVPVGNCDFPQVHAWEG